MAEDINTLTSRARTFLVSNEIKRGATPEEAGRIANQTLGTIDPTPQNLNALIGRIRGSGSNVANIGGVAGLPVPEQQTPDFNQLLGGTIPNGFASSTDFGGIVAKQIGARRSEQLRAEKEAALVTGREIGAKELGAVEGTAKALTGGELGFSSIEQSLIDNQKKRNEQRLSKIESEFRAAQLDNDTATMENLRAERKDRLEQILAIDKLVTNRLTRALVQKQEGRAETQLDISTINTLTNVSAGQTVEIGGQTFTGLKPDEGTQAFFKGSDVINAMKALAPGETTTLTDPNTGIVFSIQGIGAPDLNTKVIQSTDDKGNVKITTINTDSGEIISQVDAGAIGKTKAAPISISLGIRAETRDLLTDSSTAIQTATDPTTGKVNQDVLFAERTKFGQQNAGDTQPFDDTFSDKFDPNDPRSASVLPSAALPEPVDPIDTLINDILEESFPNLFGETQ